MWSAPDDMWSQEARVLVDPAGVFRQLTREPRARGAGWRRPLALLFAFGCLVSILASGRFSVRLIADGAVSFAFVVAVEVAALALVSRRPAPFARTVDLFFVGNAPWLLWMVVLGAVFGVLPPRALSPWVRSALFGSVIPAVWSAWIDFHFFREVLGQSAGQARRTLLLNRSVGWVAAIGIFLGIAIWSLYGTQVSAWVGL